MKGPANPGGVMIGGLFAVLLILLCLYLGLGSTTRRGMPVWLLAIVGTAGFVGVMVRSWRKPRRTKPQP